jgi:opacity protein-like surface antigen
LKNVILVAGFVLLGTKAFAGLSGLGLGVHGGIISGYDNPVLEDSILSQFASFDMPEKMTDIGAHLNIGTFKVIEFDINIDYAWKKQEIVSGIDLRFSDFSISASIRKSIALAAFKPYIGVGVGQHWMAYSIEFGNQIIGVVLPEDESKVGYHFKAGVNLDFPVFPLTPYGEWRYNIIQTAGESTKYTAIFVGITLDLP